MNYKVFQTDSGRVIINLDQVVTIREWAVGWLVVETVTGETYDVQEPFEGLTALLNVLMTSREES